MAASGYFCALQNEQKIGTLYILVHFIECPHVNILSSSSIGRDKWLQVTV
jgi:hypothetical protein